MTTRRRFLQQAGLVSATPFVPGFVMNGLANAQNAADDNGRILVIIQLDGGNDGLNTIVPYAQDGYRKLRPELALSANQILKIDDQIGFHPAMGAAAEVLQSGRLSVIQNVGYPNPNRSHFRSMAIWQTASNADDLPQMGWAGRALDLQASGGTDSLFVGTEDLPLTLRGRRSVATSMEPGKLLQLRTKLNPVKAISDKDTADDIHAFVRRNVLEAYRTVEELNAPDKPSAAVPYPSSGIAQRLRTIARFIGMETSARVYYAIQSGYDTHENQATTHTQLLSDFSRAVKAFMDDLQTMGLQDRVMLMAFSEFGRRVSENGSAGTDHGTAGPMFLAGTNLRTGLIGAAPDLGDLDGDDLKVQIDFRQVYAGVLDEWLQIPSENPLGRRFPPLSIFREA